MSDPRHIFTVIGLQRSGNHAVIDWIGSLYPSFAFYNNNPHDLFADVDGLKTLIASRPEPCIVFSFEDSPGKTPDATQPLVASVTSFPADRFADFDCLTLFILRDPYNHWASRVVGHSSATERGTGLTSDPSWDHFRRNWLAFADLRSQRPDDFILFNDWFRRADYRRDICRRLGGTYCETTLNQIPTAGGGSSFDATPRKSYGVMLRNWRHYVSAGFLTKLMRKPTYYLRRVLSRPQLGSQLKVDQRWQAISAQPEAQALFSDAAIRAQAQGLFDASILPPQPALAVIAKSGT